MNATADMLEARLDLVGRIHRVELELAGADHARAAIALVRGKSHELGNQVQIAHLATLELSRRAGPARADLVELIDDLRAATDAASRVLRELLAGANPPHRTDAGPAVAPEVRAAVELARTAIAPPIDLQVELAETVTTRGTARELEALVLAALLDAADATRISLLVRERTIAGTPWVEVLRGDDRRDELEDDGARAFEAPSRLGVVRAIARAAGGDASLSPGRGGPELAIELPVA